MRLLSAPAIGLLVVCAALGATPAAQPPAGIAVAAASDLHSLLPELARRFERETGIKTTVSFGSSGNVFAQIQNGAPFDVFMSADIDYPRRLVTSGHADADTLRAYATGRLVLWTRHASGIDVAPGLKAVADARVRRIAIANPKVAPYGRAAVAALQHEGLYEQVQPKLVLGDNISQTAQLVESGNADVGILAMSLALAPEMAASGSYAEIPPATHPPIEQGAVVLTASKNKDAARRFLATLERADTLDLLRRFGFTPPAK